MLCKPIRNRTVDDFAECAPTVSRLPTSAVAASTSEPQAQPRLALQRLHVFTLPDHIDAVTMAV